MLVDMDKKVAVLESSVSETNVKVGQNYDLIKIVLTELRPFTKTNQVSYEGVKK